MSTLTFVDALDTEPVAEEVSRVLPEAERFVKLMAYPSDELKTSEYGIELFDFLLCPVLALRRQTATLPSDRISSRPRYEVVESNEIAWTILVPVYAEADYEELGFMGTFREALTRVAEERLKERVEEVMEEMNSHP